MKKYNILASIAFTKNFHVEAENGNKAWQQVMNIINDTPRDELRKQIYNDWDMFGTNFEDISEDDD